MKISSLFIEKTKIRDAVVLLSYALLASFLAYLTIFDLTLPSFAAVTFFTVLVSQFYLSAFLHLPIAHYYWRQGAYVLFFSVNYVLLRQILIALTYPAVTANFKFEVVLAVSFLATLVGRNVRMYVVLIANLQRLNALREYNQLFKKQEQVTINFGQEGKLDVHPNEIVYIRTKTAGDHTKVFGLKVLTEGKQSKLVEYETTAYQNFNEIFQWLQPFPQFKRISQSTVLNFQYPYEEKKGSILIESRRFAVSPKYSQARLPRS